MIGEGGVYVFLFPLAGAYICLYFLWHLVIHPILSMMADNDEKRKAEAENKLWEDYADALHRKNLREVRKLIPPHQHWTIDHL